jgi:hypothetical protein
MPTDDNYSRHSRTVEQATPMSLRKIRDEHALSLRE